MARAVFASLHTLRPPVAPNIPCKSKVVYLSFLGTLFIWGGLCAIGFPIQSGPFFGPKLPNWPTQTPGTLTDQGQLASLWARSHQLASPAPATRSRQLVSPWPFPQTLSVCPRILRALRLCVGLGDTPNPARSGRVAKWPCGPCPRPHQLASPCGPGSTPTGQSTPWPGPWPSCRPPDLARLPPFFPGVAALYGPARYPNISLIGRGSKKWPGPRSKAIRPNWRVALTVAIRPGPWAAAPSRRPALPGPPMGRYNQQI